MSLRTDRNHAFSLRKQGKSYREIYEELGIPKSTLSGWFRNIELSSESKYIIKQRRLKHLQDIRKLAVLWHNEQKQIRLKIAQSQALSIFSKLDINNKSILELALAMLYLGEGSKKTPETSMGNSSPLILRFFIACLRKIYNFDTSSIKCELHLRADQNPNKLKQYWSKELSILLVNFTYVNLDKRTLGRPTYSSYHGVCLLRCGNIAIQRRLVYLSQIFCENVNQIGAVSSVGRAPT